MVRRMGEPVIRTALRHGMRVLARQFVMGRTIEEALARAGTAKAGAGATASTCWARRRRTHADAERYHARLPRCDRRDRARGGGAGRSRGRGFR